MAALEVDGLSISFGAGASLLTPVEAVSFSVAAGEVLGLVGESGCGKTLTGLAILGVLPEIGGRISGGSIRVNGVVANELSRRQLRELRGTGIGFIAQNPMTSLDPLLPVGKQIAEVAQCKLGLPARQAAARAVEAMVAVGIPDAQSVYRQYPHQLSGGLRQRVVIAAAVILDPRLIIADEPTTALDVSIQAQVIGMLRRRTRDAGSALLLITHDLGIVAETCDRVAVMYAGSIVEAATTAELLAAPKHPYTQALLACVPRMGVAKRSLRPIEGEVPSAERFPAGCKFHPRCPARFSDCLEVRPVATAVNEGATVACHLFSAEHRP